MRFILLFLFLISNSFASLQDKSAIVYYGDDISYSMVGIHDYIIVESNNINTNTHGFSLYKDKIYAYVSLWEIDKNLEEYKSIKKSWKIAENKIWDSDILDLKNPNYKKFLFERMIEPKIKKGFKNFFFDTLDSYKIFSKTKKQREVNEKALISFINEFHERYPDSKLIVNRGFEIIDKIHNSIEAVLFESYYHGIGDKNLSYKKVTNSDRKWLDTQLSKIKSYNKNIICVDYLKPKNMNKACALAKKIKDKGMIPYIANRELDIYGVSNKNPIKREVLTIINEKNLDRILQEAHQYGALPLEYLGYIQKLYNIQKGLPKVEKMTQYAGVIIWLQDMIVEPDNFIKWLTKLKKAGIKIVFMNNFGFNVQEGDLNGFDMNITYDTQKKIDISHQDDMIGYDINPSLSLSTIQIKSKFKKELLTYKLEDSTKTTSAAITDWGGYAIDDAFMLEIDKDNLWVINPFKFFKEALNLKTLIVPDVTTENGKRLLFTHIDGDGIMNRYEPNTELFSGDIIRDEILKKYKIPHSVSVIGAEIDKNGLYPKLSKRLTQIAKDIYALKNVEGATHTFTHPFYWGEIKNDTLDKKYRLKVKNYNFSLNRELKQTIDNINKNLMPENKHNAKTIFWSGDCAPRENALDVIYKNKLLNINGGDTSITNLKPWLTQVAPLGIKRGDYYQIYTGEQNENIYTNEWLGPFWGFKKVIQTFKLTNSPRRLKPIDIYYHFYSGSKTASINALKYVFNWAIKQDVMPIYTSEYIPKVMDYYDVSLANENDIWLLDGMKNLKTIRVEEEKKSVDIANSNTVIGENKFETHTYIHLSNEQKHIIKFSNKPKKTSFLISANAKVSNYKNTKKTKLFQFDGDVDLKLEFNLADNCKLNSIPKQSEILKTNLNVKLFYINTKKAKITITCSDQ